MAYISPEQIEAGPVKPQSDIYGLGLVFYEMLTGQPGFTGATPLDLIQQHLNQPVPPLQLHRSHAENGQGQLEALNPVISRATAKNPADRYPDMMAMLADIRQALQLSAASGLYHRLLPGPAAPRPSHQAALENPFKGLRAFTAADTADFFGRDTLIQELLGLLSETNELARFLAVVGPSGSGKSSVVKAGLLPILRQGGLPDSDHWFILEMMPGRHPLEELEAALLRIAVNPPDSLLSQLREDERGLLRAVHRILPADDRRTELLLVIDQFEELFTQCEDETIRVHFLDSLVTASLDPRSRLRVIITLRADFTDRPLQYVDFGELVRQRTEFVLPLTPDELEEAITRPPQRVGLSLEPGLVTAIIRDLGDQPGTLPLLQYTLTELFERRVGTALTLGAYQTSGGVRAALAGRADKLYIALDDADQAAARQLFLRLITLGEVTNDGLPAPDTRRRVLRSELAALTQGEREQPLPLGSGAGGDSEIDSVIDTFGRHRLLTFDRDPLTRGPTVEVAHEALIREWSRLRAWLDEDREYLFWQQRLRAGLHQWQTSNYDEGALLRGAPLAEAENWLTQRRNDLNETEREFIQAGLTLQERRAAEREAQLRRELEVAQELVKETEARRLAEAQHAQEAEARAQEQVWATASLHQRAMWLAAVGVMALVLAVAAGMFGLQARQNAQEAITAQQIAEREVRRAKAEQLVLQTQALLENKEDPFGSLPLLLAREAVLTTLIPDGYFTLEADASLYQAIEAAPPWRMTLPQPNMVHSIAFSPDGNSVITAGGDGFVRVWDVGTGAEVLTGHRDPAGRLYYAAFSPNGRMIAIVGEGGLAELRDATTSEQTLHRLKGHTSAVLSAAFSPDGQKLATGGYDGIVMLWDVPSGQAIRHFKVPNARIEKVIFSPDGRTLVTSDGAFSAQLWDIASGQVIRRFAGHTKYVSNFAVSPDGQTLVTASDDQTARLWNVTTGEEIRQFRGHTDAINWVDFSPDGQTIVTAGVDGTVRLWNVASGEEISRLEGHSGIVLAAIFSPDGQTIATAGIDQTIRLWDAKPNNSRWRIETRGQVTAIAAGPDSNTVVLASNLPGGEAGVWNLTSGKELVPLNGHIGEVTAVAVSPDGKLIATAGSDKTIRLWASATGAQISILTGHEDYIFEVAFSPTGESIVSASADKTARIWDTASGQEIARLMGHASQVRSAAYSPDGQTIITAGGFQDPTARLWAVANGQEIRKFVGHTDILNSAGFSPDGKTVVTAGGDGTIRLWDSSTGQEIRQFKGHDRGVNSATFSPDGQSLVTAGSDQTVRVWDVVTGQEIRRLEGHTGPVNNAIFSPDGQTLITAGADKTVRIWPGVEQMLAIADSLIQRDPPEFTPEERTRFGVQ